jgi:hypothetical protein
MSFAEVQSVVDKAAYRGGVLGVRFVSTDEDDISPWLYSPSGRKPEVKIKGPLPASVELMLANQIYISKEGLPPVLKNKLIRLAAFQNPEFYKAQAMRFPTYDKPRIVHCCEDFPKHIGLPIGCLGDIIELLHSLGIKTEVTDERFAEVRINAKFIGEGFDDERLDTLFLTLPISWRGTINQYAGRLHRIHDSKKKVMIYDYADLNVSVLARMYDRRLKGYRSIGYEIEDDKS